MPELPEVEVLVRHLASVLPGRRIRAVEIRRRRVIRPGSVAAFKRAVIGARFTGVSRRGKYLLFALRPPRARAEIALVGHLGMTGRLYVERNEAPLARHAAVVMDLGGRQLVFEDTRYFGRLSLDRTAVDRLGPEPLGRGFTRRGLAASLARSRQAIKVRLLDQGLVAGVGNIYASEALFRARIAPQTRADRLDAAQVGHLYGALRRILREAIRFGSTVPLAWRGGADRLFYYGRSPEAEGSYTERLAVYDRADQPCPGCGAPIRRMVQAGRSTFYCPCCQV